MTGSIFHVHKQKSRRKHIQWYLCALAALVMLLNLLAPAAQASWDGNGSAGGSNADEQTGSFLLNNANVNDVYGYRFSVYDGAGNKLGYSIDILFKTEAQATNRSVDQKSHVELYDAYLEDESNVSLGTMASLKGTASNQPAYGLYYDSTLPATPTEVEDWLTQAKGYEIAQKCEAYDFGSFETNYIICEPLFAAVLDGAWYCMTLAEYAVYQSTQYGWDTVPGTYTSNTYMTVMRQLSACFGRYLYAEENYSDVFKVKQIPAAAFTTDNNGADSILLGQTGTGAGNTQYPYNSFNTAENVLKYQMGMAIYSDVIPAYTDSISHWMGGFRNGEGNNSDGSVFRIATTSFSQLVDSSFVLDANYATTIPNGFYLRQTFGTSAITGSWGSYSLGTEVTQAEKSMSFEYYYNPYSYNITYNLNGGTNNAANPSSYNVLYGVSLEAPTRDGYTFAGWYIGSTKVTGINEGADATFDSVDDMYSKLASRTTGDIELTAVWTANTYTDGIVHWMYGFQNGEGNNGDNTAFRIATTSFSQLIGSSFVLDANYATTIPNGFRLAQTFGTRSITGSWGSYSLGTEVTQAEKSMHFEYYYRPYSYNITYNLDGGFNHSSNPTSYNVLYGVSLEVPTREGYNFAGWLEERMLVLDEDAQTHTNQVAGNVLRATKVQLFSSNGDTQGSFLEEIYSTSGAGDKSVAYMHELESGYYYLRIAIDGSTKDYNHGFYKVFLENGKTYNVDWTVSSASTAAYAISRVEMNSSNIVTGINEGANATFESADDMYSKLASRTTGDIELTAMWTADEGSCTYTIRYDGNGETDGTTEPSIHVYGVSSVLTPNGFIKDGYVFMGWNTKADGTGTSYADGESVLNLTSTNNDVITLYAVWSSSGDGLPVISAIDRWFTLGEAKSGAVTLEELMSTASATDSSIGLYTDFSAGEGTFTVIDYSESDFMSFTSAGSVTVTYYAKDLAGNEAYKTVTVYIVDEYEDIHVDSAMLGVRFISHEYYLDASNGFITPTNGGLVSYSKWVLDMDCVTLLTNTLNNKQVDGNWTTGPLYSFVFNSETIYGMKDSVQTNGPGNDLDAFFEEFLKQDG